ncbi:MAG: hypothetical protein VXW38_15225 [Bacteroidota bacterium]|nr:hypothetical protein [Bacteroidota bacterium]
MKLYLYHKYRPLKNSILPILFTLLYVMAMIRPVLPVIDYVINQDYIAEYLCVNKDKPMLNCNGKCYLAKMLQKERDEKKQNLPAIDLKEYPIGFVEVFEQHFGEQAMKKGAIPNLGSSEPNQFIDSIFHPPNC